MRRTGRRRSALLALHAAGGSNRPSTSACARRRRLALQTAQGQTRAGRHRQLVALRQRALPSSSAAKGSSASWRVGHDQQARGSRQRGASGATAAHAAVAGGSARASVRLRQVCAHRRGAVAQRLDLEARRRAGVQHLAPRGDAAMQRDAGARDDAGKQFVVEHAVLDQRVARAERRCSSPTSRCVVGAATLAGAAVRRSRARAVRAIAFGAAQFFAQAAGRLAFFLLALHAAVQPVQAVAQRLRRRRSALGPRLLSSMRSPSVRARTRSSWRSTCGGAGAGRARAWASSGQAQQLLVGPQVVGQEGAAQVVARQRAALLLEQLDGGGERACAAARVARGSRRQAQAGQAAHLHRQQLQVAAPCASVVSNSARACSTLPARSSACARTTSARARPSAGPQRRSRGRARRELGALRRRRRRPAPVRRAPARPRLRRRRCLARRTAPPRARTSRAACRLRPAAPARGRAAPASRPARRACSAPRSAPAPGRTAPALRAAGAIRGRRRPAAFRRSPAAAACQLFVAAGAPPRSPRAPRGSGRAPVAAAPPTRRPCACSTGKPCVPARMRARA